MVAKIISYSLEKIVQFFFLDSQTSFTSLPQIFTPLPSSTSHSFTFYRGACRSRLCSNFADFFMVPDSKNKVKITWAFLDQTIKAFLLLIFKVCQNHDSYYHHDLGTVHRASMSPWLLVCAVHGTCTHLTIYIYI